MKSKLIAILAAVFLAGCHTCPTIPDPVEKPPVYGDVVLPVVRGTDLKDVKWELMDQAELQKLVEEKKNTKGFFVYVLDQSGMETEIGNMQELRRYIQQQQAAIEFLVGVIKSRQTPKAESTKQ